MNAKQKISKYTTYGEATKSYTALRLGIPNIPNQEQFDNIHYLLNTFFDPMREHIGGPVFLHKVFVVPAVNANIKGASATSAHMRGEAFDADADQYGIGTNKQIFDFFKNSKLPFDQIIWELGDENEPDWVHVAGKRDLKLNRRRVTRCIRVGNELKYIPFDLY